MLAALALAPGALAQRRLDVTNFIVVGEGLAAGQSNYTLSEVVQRFNFPALMARQMGALFPQPILLAPGAGDALGVQALPARIPAYPAGSVREFARVDPPKRDEGPTLFIFNVSVPNHRLEHALSRRPVFPLIHENNTQQTLLNLLLGIPNMLFDTDVPLWTQVEYAEAMNPTLALVELGYYEALEAAVSGDPSRIPDPAAFRANYNQVLQRLRRNFAEVVATTIPDPMDTAYWTPAVEAANFLRTPPYVVLLGYGVTEQDYVSRNALYEIGNQLIRRRLEPLPAGSILRAAVAAQIRQRVRALNNEITAAARDAGAQVYDLAALFARVKTQGVQVGSRRVTGEYLGGFYSLDGFYPGITGHAIIANEILSLLNRTYSRSFSLLNLAQIAAQDAAFQDRQAPALFYTEAELDFVRPVQEPIE